MNFHILTLMPEVLSPYFAASILGHAQESGKIRVHLHQLRDYAKDKHKSVDDRPYGGGPGMVFKPDVVVEAVEDLKKRYSIARVVLTSPRGTPFRQADAKRLKACDPLLLICGRYEGVDERAIQLVVDEEISIGDYVITGGELAAAVVVDTISRLIPGVIGDDQAPMEESHEQGLLEYPHYTRPENYRGLQVPEVLLSGDHGRIAEWRQKESEKITIQRRPDIMNIKK